MTTLANCFLSYFGNIWSSFLATLTRSLFCSSVNRFGTHLAEIFLTFKCFFKIRWTVDSDMPTFRAISRTVNLTSPSMISFILETISLRDADFGLPDFGALLMDYTRLKFLFPPPNCVIKVQKKLKFQSPASSKYNQVLSELWCKPVFHLFCRRFYQPFLLQWSMTACIQMANFTLSLTCTFKHHCVDIEWPYTGMYWFLSCPTWISS